MKKTNKLLSVLLTLALFASLLPFAALPARADSAPTGGYCGDASFSDGKYVAWQLVGGTLTVTVTSSVEGSMKDYLAEDNTAPWHDSCTDITSVVIGSGVKTIGAYAFYGCTGVTSVVIPDSVTSIGKGAFQDCTALKYVFFPNTNTQLSIGENAFSGCAEGLTFYGDKSQSLGGITLHSCVTPDTWSKLQTALNSVNGAAYIKLNQDFTRGEGVAALTVSAGKTILLDLNGHTISGGGSGSVLTVNGSLTLADCDRSYSSFGGGKATGKITGGSATYGGGVYVSEGGTFNMLGGEVSGNTASGYGGGVYVYNGTFTLSGGTIGGTGENDKNTASDGGGVYVSGTFTMTGGEISGNKTGEYSNGGGVYVGTKYVDGKYVGGTFTMTGGTVSRNEATSAYDSAAGGGVYVGNDGAFDMSGGAVSGNTANQGGGVFLDGTFTLSGGTVSGNTATYGGGVLVSSGTFRVSGAPVVRDNSNKNGPSNVKLNGQPIAVTDELTDGAALWIYAAEGAVVATGDGYTLTDADAEKFHGDRFGVGALREKEGKTVVELVFRSELRTVGVADGKLTVTVAAPANSTLIAASYDENDRLTGVATTTFSERETGTVEVSALPANAARYRVFLVNGSYAPLCPAAAFKPGT